MIFGNDFVLNNVTVTSAKRRDHHWVSLKQWLGLLFGGYRWLSPHGKRPGHESDHLFQSSAQIKDGWKYSCIPLYALVSCPV